LVSIPATPISSSSRTAAATTTTTSLFAIGILARKAKEKDIRAYVEGGIEPSVMQQIQKLDAYLLPRPPEDTTSAKPSSAQGGGGPVQQALTKRKGTITVIAEYKRNFEQSGFISGEIYEPILISPVFREFGASAIAVSTDSRLGGATYTDLQAFVQEQSTAKGNVPGPLPVINHDFIVDPIQLCRSVAYGAQAVVIQLQVVGLDKVQHFITCAQGLNVECILAVTNLEEAQLAIQQTQASILYFVGPTTQEKIQIFHDLTDTIQSTSRPICFIADILTKENKGFEEVEEAWTLRDKGFHAVWVSDTLYKAGNDPTEHCGAIIQSMKAKSSVKWASAKARSGKGEGAREYLGDLLM